MSDNQEHYELVYRFGDVTVELTAIGLRGITWARIVNAIHTELSKPDFIISLPDGRLSAEEADRVRQQWTAKHPKTYQT